MNSTSPVPGQGRVASLHLHPPEPGDPMCSVAEIQVESGKGITGEPRYFARVSRTSGRPSRRHVTLIEREQIAEHATSLGMQTIPPGEVRSNIETEGIRLNEFLGHEIQAGEAVLRFYEHRTPCSKMDAVCQGLRAEMEDGRQGVVAEVVKGGRIQRGDPIG